MGMIWLTHFPTKYATEATRHELSWRDFAKRLETAPPYPEKEKAPLIKLATFGERRTEARSLRSDENVLEVYGIEGDYDAEKVSPEEAIRQLEDYQIRATVATTWRHTAEKPRWRVFCPLSAPVPPEARRALVARLNGALGGILQSESFALSQSYFVGGRPGGEYIVLHTFDDPEDGFPIDEIDKLDHLAAAPALELNGKRQAAMETSGNTEMSDELVRALEEDAEIRLLWTAGKGDGADHSVNDFALARELAYKGFGDDDIEAALRAYPLGQSGPEGKYATDLGMADRAIARCLAGAQEKRKQAGERKAPSEDGNHPKKQKETLGFSHDALALDLGETWLDARYVAVWGKWLFYENGIWRVDETLQHMTRTRHFLRALADRLRGNDKVDTKKLRDKTTVAAVADLARSNPRQAAAKDLWDRDKLLIGGEDGTIELRSGTTYKPRLEDYITKALAVLPAAHGVEPTRFLEFLGQVTKGDEELCAYLQRVMGYCLTGEVKEHALFFVWGPGANGKTVFIETMEGIWGDYAITIDPDMLLVVQNERHPTDIAQLRGKRLAIGGEVDVGRTWAEAKIKRLTGGEELSGRFMRQDFFNFQPQFKLVIAGNHKPSLRSVDEAIRRRLHLIPFTVTIPPAQRDRDLKEKLRAEWPAILRWAVDGCVAWQERGLDPPEAVRAATEEYMESEDAITQWLDDRTVDDVNKWTSSADLFASWKRWAEAANEYIGTQKRLIEELKDRKYIDKREGGTGRAGLRGLALKEIETAEDVDRRYR